MSPRTKPTGCVLGRVTRVNADDSANVRVGPPQATTGAATKPEKVRVDLDDAKVTEMAGILDKMLPGMTVKLSTEGGPTVRVFVLEREEAKP